MLVCSSYSSMKKYAAFLSVLLLLDADCILAQYYVSANNTPEGAWVLEGGIQLAAVNCLTDIGGSHGGGKKFLADCNWNQTKPGFGLTVDAIYQSWISIGFQANFLRISGDDALLSGRAGEAQYRFRRNLRFRTQLAECTLRSDCYLWTLLHRSDDPPVCSPFVSLGIGGFYYNPQASMNNTWVDLRPLHTEGQGFAVYPNRSPYAAWTWCVPVGLGIRYDAGKAITAKFNLLYRFTGTDYLDDVSTAYIDPKWFDKYLGPVEAKKARELADRSIGFSNTEGSIRGNPANRDAYFSVQLGIAIVFDRWHRK